MGVILPVKGDSGLLNFRNQKTINRMLKNGIQGHLYPGMTRVKVAVFGGRACPGSANFDKLGLQINQEIDLEFSNAAAVEQLMEHVSIPDFEICSELSEPLTMANRHHFGELIADELF